MDDRVQGIVRRPVADPSVQGDVSFGPFRLYAKQRRLEKDGHPLPLSTRAFDILVALVEQAGTIVSKNDLIARVWPGINVDEGSLRVHVASLRKALGDGEAGARYLTTVSGHGYCFVGDVARHDVARPVPVTEKSDNLPARQIEMVGRDQTVSEISEKLTGSRFVTIVGPGGIGKTTVAISAGRALLDKFAGHVRFIDLDAIRDATLVPGIVASALGLPARSSDPTDSLAAFLRDKQMLLILDCCEHVIDTTAALVERLYREAPQLHVLATSRESLRVEGEHIHRLLPLAYPPEGQPLTAVEALAFPAVKLFVARAIASGGGFELTDASATDVGTICRRLDGIALAIELAAGRIGVYGVTPMIEFLDKQFNMLWEGRRTAVPRHRTLRATIEWSYDLLSQQEREVLCRLSVFFGGFTLEAARAIARTEETDDHAVMAALASLVAKSMLTLDSSKPSARYRLLDVTRAFAQEKLAAGGKAEMMARRHACYFLELLERLGDNPDESLPAVADQFGSVRSALTWCFSERGDRTVGVALAAASIPLFFELSFLAECELWSMRAIEAIGAVSGSERHDLALHAALGSARMLSGQIDEATSTTLWRALALAEKIGDTRRQLRLLDRLHWLQLFTGRIDESLNIARRGETVAGQSDDLAALARMRVSLSISYHFFGDVAASRSHIEAALLHSGLEADVHRSLTFDYPRRAQITLARILWLQGYFDQAMETARAALADVAAVDQPIKLCRALLWAYAVFYWNQELDEFEEHIERLRTETRRYNLGSLQIFGDALKGTALLERGEVDAALALLQGSVEKMHSNRFNGASGFNIPLARALAAANRPNEALQVIERAIDEGESCNFGMEMSDMLRLRGELLTSGDNMDLLQAENTLLQSLELARTQGALGYELRTAVSLARLWRRQDRRKEAHGMLAPILARFSEGFRTRGYRAAADLLAELASQRPGSLAVH
ncbi:helix-turn-helix transcriptional regulator [Bradyrhizobium lablabi]|uniref:ATP-binding protein n=1 Tax=Bradyrhizobium lablabi TaxID=722472 RepID=UPI001BAC5E81|nr:winged helix-turn-helix domain-containing protein [Bradyrhizobium lablabi]MBR1119901.1 helix-turn-helix transcriptional regulator [Bradyrhizobium lablabi]